MTFWAIISYHVPWPMTFPLITFSYPKQRLYVGIQNVYYAQLKPTQGRAKIH
jgi:hypothetical protein